MPSEAYDFETEALARIDSVYRVAPWVCGDAAPEERLEGTVISNALTDPFKCLSPASPPIVTTLIAGPASE